MRNKVIAGNWKMNNSIEESVKLISELKQGLTETEVKVIICPPFTSLETANALIKESQIELGAQNMHNETSGAFTGEISASMLKSVGCKYVILGHSERRAIFGESNEFINKKVHKALSENLVPILCVGESLEEREKNITKDVVKKQLLVGLDSVSSEHAKDIIIAYEPVWAIGTGKTASPEQAQEVHEFIRTLLDEKYGKETAENIIIQYGGSVKPENATELLSQKDIDGALVGGACLKADSFLGIIKAAKI
ncbi:MAG: triose-phosphate isomerase [Ignavibacteriaceae bacterium]|jgi:triosephosphate isomerase|nr:triose-phosphate isomerase [Ignavibacteriaceae bacterium]